MKVVLSLKTTPIGRVVWCPSLDLVATLNGGSDRLSVLRALSWTSLWQWPPGKDEATHIAAVVWRPDGRAIGVQTTDALVLLDIEHGDVLLSVKTGDVLGGLTDAAKAGPLHWFYGKQEPSPVHKLRSIVKLKPFAIESLVQDKDGADHGDMATTATAAATASTGATKPLGLVLSANAKGTISVSFEGYLTVADTTLCPQDDTCISVVPAAQLDRLLVLHQSAASGVTLTVYDTELLHKRSSELYEMASLAQPVTQNLQRIDRAVHRTLEALKDLFSQLDGCFKHFEQTQVNVSVNNLLESAMLWSALDQRLKNFLHSVVKETGVNRLDKGVAVALRNAALALDTQIAHLGVALARDLALVEQNASWLDGFGVLGFRKENVAAAQRDLADLLAHASALSHSIKVYASFWPLFVRWLRQAAALHAPHHTGELTSERFSTEPLASYEHLHTFLRSGGTSGGQIRVLVDQPDNNMEGALVALKASLAKVWLSPSAIIGSSFRATTSTSLLAETVNVPPSHVVVVDAAEAADTCLVALVSADGTFLLLARLCGVDKVETSKIVFDGPPAAAAELAALPKLGSTLLAADFYGSEHLAVLVAAVDDDPRNAVLVQLSLENVKWSSTKQIKSHYSKHAEQAKVIGSGMSNMFLSSSRKMAVLTDSSGQHVRLVDMEDDDEDEGGAGAEAAE